MWLKNGHGPELALRPVLYPGTNLLSEAERNWIALFKAAGDRDAAALVSGSRTILASGQAQTPDTLKFLVAAGMTGSLVRGDREGSLRLWSRYRLLIFGGDSPDLLFRLLVADSTRQ